MAMNQIKFSKTLRISAKNRGYTMIEALSAMAILTIAFLALARLQMSVIHANTVSHMTDHATVLAAQCMERLLLQPYDHADTAPGIHMQHSSKRADPAFHVQWHVVLSHKPDGLKTIYIKVFQIKRNKIQVTLAGIKAREE